jgi:anaerobic selenocysteine-containing dehydrogenase
MIGRRRKDMMNSQLNDLPGLRKHGSGNRVELCSADAADRAIATGDEVVVWSEHGEMRMHAIVSDAPRPGVVVVEYGWGSGIFDPVGGAAWNASDQPQRPGWRSRGRRPVPVLNGVPVEVVRIAAIDTK